MTTFRLPLATHTETATGEGLISFDFPAGTVTPQTDLELEALKRLVDQGLAVNLDESGTKKSSAKAAEPAQPETSSTAAASDATSKE